jgi:hypothetical protein
VLDLEAGGPPVAVTDGTHDDTHPVWAPDGERIAFSNGWEGPTGRDAGPGIYVANLHGSEPELLLPLATNGVFGTFDWVRHPGRFADVGPDHVFEADVAWLAAEGITQGCNPPFGTRFCPDDPVTRGELAALLVRALDYSDDGGGDLFVDDDESIFEADIDKLATASVTRGCNPPANDRFCPDDPVTRGQIAAFLVRALGYTDDGGGNSFIDDDGSVFETDIARLAQAGVTRGCNPPVNDRFCPDDPATRGQMAALLRRALG